MPPLLRPVALIVCVTFSATSAAPAWAMRGEGASSTLVQRGLEEALQPKAIPLTARVGLEEADVWNASGFWPGFDQAGRIDLSSSAAAPLMSLSPTDTQTVEVRTRWIGGVTAPDEQGRSVLRMFQDWVRIDWPMVQWLLQHPNAVVEKWMKATIAEVIAAIQDGQETAVTAAIRRDFAFCATIGQIPSNQPTYESDELPIPTSQFTQLFDYLAQHGIQNIFGSMRPVYVVADDDDIVVKDSSSATVQFTAFTGTARTRPDPITVSGALAGRVAAFVARQNEVRAMRPANASKDPAGVAKWRDAQAKLATERRALFAEILKTLTVRATFRNALCEDYAGGRQQVSAFLALSWQLKRFRQFAHISTNESRQHDLGQFAQRLNQLIDREEQALERYRSVFIELSAEDRETVLRTITDLKDLAWNIQNDLLGNIARVRELGAMENAALDENQMPAIHRFWALTLLLNGIDSRMETRGRDSLGVSVMATFANQAVYEGFLGQLSGGLKTQWTSRQQIIDLGNMSVRVRPGVDAAGVSDPTKPVTVTFVYKVAEVVGYLGDNATAIRRFIIGDELFQTLLRQPLQHFTAVAHTRWASAGGISEPNTHPAVNEGNYVFPDGFKMMEHGAIPLEDGGYQMVAQIKTALPHYGKNGRIFVVLNGDVDNYNRARLAASGYFRNLMADYASVRGPWTSRRISVPRTSDTHWIPFRIEDYILQGYDLVGAVQRAAREFDGSFAIQVQSDLEPGKLILALNGKGQGLYVGISPDGFHPASETYGMIDVTQQFYRLKSGQVVIIDQNLAPTPENLVVTTVNGQRVPIAANDIESTTQTTRDAHKPAEYERFFVKEISEASAMFSATVLGRVLVRQAGMEESLAINLRESEFPSWIRARLRNGQFRRLIITGMGTAHAAGLVMADALKDYLAHEAKHPLAIETPLAPELAAYMLSPDMTDTLIVCISQSGKSTDTNDPLTKAIGAGATAIGILNTRDSDATFIITKNERDPKTPKHDDEGDGGVIYTGTGRDIELAVASTKAYYAQIAAGVILAMAIARELGVADSVFLDDAKELAQLPDKMHHFEQSVTQSKGQHPLIQAAQVLPLLKIDWSVVSTGPGMAAAREAVIKLSELCYRCIYQDTFVNLKHVNYSAEALVFFLLANLRGKGDFVQTNGEGEFDKMVAQALNVIVIVEEGNNRFDHKQQQMYSVTGEIASRPVDVIKVPKTTERFAPIFLAMASHLLAYYSAEAINARGRQLLSALNAVTAVRAGLVLHGTTASRMLQNSKFQMAARNEFGPILQAIQAGEYNVLAKDPRRLVEFARLLPYLTGELDLSTTEFFLGRPMTAEQVWAYFEGVAIALGRGGMRTIDAIARQAKYVTVGAKTETERPGNVQRLVEAFQDHDTTKLDRHTLVELAHAYQAYRANSRAVCVAIPDPASPFTRTRLITVGDDVPGMRHGVDDALNARSVNIQSSVTDSFYDGDPEKRGEDGGRAVAFIIDTIARPVTAVDALQLSQAVEERLGIMVMPNGENVGTLMMQLVARDRTLSQAKIFGGLYRQCLEEGRLQISNERPTSELESRTPLFLAFPYNDGMHTQAIGPALVPRIQAYLQTLLKSGDTNPVAVADLFVMIHRDTPTRQPVALVSVSLNNTDLARFSVDLRGNVAAIRRAIDDVLGEYIQQGDPARPTTAGQEESQAAVEAMRQAYETYQRLHQQITSVPGLPRPKAIKGILDLVEAGQLAMARSALLDIFGSTRRIRYSGDDENRYTQMKGGLASALEVISNAVAVPHLGAPPEALLVQGLGEIESDFGQNRDVGAFATGKLHELFRRYIATGEPQRWAGEDGGHSGQVLFLSVQPDTAEIDARTTGVMAKSQVNLELTESETILKNQARPLDVLVLRVDLKTSKALLEHGALGLAACRQQLDAQLDELARHEQEHWERRLVPAATLTAAGAEEIQTASRAITQPVTVSGPQTPSTAMTFSRLQVTMTESGTTRQAVGRDVTMQSNLAVLAGKALNDALGLAAAFQWSSSLPVVMVARDEAHVDQIEAGLAALPVDAQIQVLKIVHVAPGSTWNPDGLDYESAAQRVAEQLKDSGFASYKIQLFLNQSLFELSQFLGLPVGGASLKVFQELQRQTDKTFA